MEDLRGSSGDWGFNYQAPQPTSVWDAMSNAISSWGNWRMDQAPTNLGNWDPFTQPPPANAWQSPMDVGGILKPLKFDASVLLNRTYNEVPRSRGLFDWLQRRPETVSIDTPLIDNYGQYWHPAPGMNGGFIEIDPRLAYKDAQETLVHEAGHARDLLKYGPNNPRQNELSAQLSAEAPHLTKLYPQEQYGQEYYARALTDRIYGRPTLGGLKPWTPWDRFLHSKMSEPMNWLPSPLAQLRNLLKGYPQLGQGDIWPLPKP